MGFDTINKLAKQYNIEINQKKFKGLCGTGTIENQKVLLLKPQTYMNLSGKSIIEAMNFYKMPLENLIIIYDDIDTEKSIIKIRKKGGAGTHNGMKSVVEQLGSKDFARVKVGIGKPQYKDDLINYVIGKMPKEEKEILEKATTNAKDAIIEILKIGIDKAMNKIN